jgi:hypothetical protein
MIGNGDSNNAIVKPEFSVYQPLSVNGDGTGNFSQKVDGSVTPVKFYIQKKNEC